MSPPRTELPSIRSTANALRSAAFCCALCGAVSLTANGVPAQQINVKQPWKSSTAAPPSSSDLRHVGTGTEAPERGAPLMPRRLPPTSITSPVTIDAAAPPEMRAMVELGLPTPVFQRPMMQAASPRPEILPVPPAAAINKGFTAVPHESDVLGDFSPLSLPIGSAIYNPAAQQHAYDSVFDVPTQRPWVEWPRRFYGDGIAPIPGTFFGETNLAQPLFTVYGDYRSGVAAGRNAVGRIDNAAVRLNLDLDLQLTATERFHAFIGPLNRAGQFTQARLIDGSVELDTVFNPNLVTGFFEGDAGALMGGFDGTPSPFELPFTVGLVPLLFQNGVWMEDAATGVAAAIPARHSVLLDWANFDVTGFAVFDQLNSPAFGTDEHAAQAFGAATFIDAYGGYIEAGCAYLNDRHDLGRSYHNFTASFTRRYFDRISNSVRVIINAGQDLPAARRTADGGLLLVENGWVTADALRVFPYFNLFYGWDRPQSVARAALSGGILRNVGISFDTDGLNGYPTLDASANNTFGGALGIDLLGQALDRQLILELAYLNVHSSDVGRIARGNQAAFGARYQFPISHRTLLRFDGMYGWRDSEGDVFGSRMEFRWKF